MSLYLIQHQKLSSYQQTPSKSGRIRKHRSKPFRIHKSLFQHYYQHLRLNHNYISAKSAFNFYVNEKISFLLGTPVNTESARETFYRELIQNTNLPTNHNFASIITEINKEIEHHIQQRYPITYASKDKEKLQTLMVTPKKIQPPTWKKTRVESPIVPSYHYTLESAINITLASASTLNAISTFRQFPFQKFTYQNPILENLEFGTPNIQTQRENPEIKTPNIQALQNQNPKVINQHLPPIIVIDQPPVEPIGQPIQIPNQQTQQPSLVLPQQQQQLPLQQQQQMAYTPITKLDKFTSKKNDAQVWLNNIEKAITANRWNDARAMQAIPYFLKNTADSWYQSLVDKPQDFNAFKLEFLRYFSNNNSINRLANTFTTIKQEETEAVTTYLGCFHRNLNILQHIHPLHPATLQDTVTHARDFESAKLKTNHAYAVNLVMNGLSELDSKLKQFSNSINQKLEGYLADIRAIYQLPQQCNNPGNANHFQNQSCLSSLLAAPNQLWQPETHQQFMIGKSISKPRSQISNSKSLPKSRSNYLPANDAATNLSTTSILISNLSTAVTNNLSAATPNNLSTPINSDTAPKFKETKVATKTPNLTVLEFCRAIYTQNQSNLELPEGCCSAESIHCLGSSLRLFLQLPDELEQPPTSNIPPAMITENESLDAIFLFELKKLSTMPLFSGAVLEEKLITAMYTDAKIDGHPIKLILDSGSAGSIIARQLMDQLADGATKTPIGEIDDLPIEINGIIVPIKVLVIEATQYQALVGNDWLSKMNTTLDWNTQELQLSQNGQHTQVPATCGYFKTTNSLAPLIDFEEKTKPTWEAYQLGVKRRKEKRKREGGEKHLSQQHLYPIHLHKKLSSMSTCCGDNEEYQMATKFYCCACLIKHFGRPKQVGKWDNTPCLACGETLLDEGMWNNIPGKGGTCNISCQYTILISN
ncbi:hypothetical protein G9A89_019776 [Geosiphon pyriformis]|nr:hypothetical protein G9A89_019776 [Geosiphon pyriformis]